MTRITRVGLDEVARETGADRADLLGWIFEGKLRAVRTERGGPYIPVVELPAARALARGEQVCDKCRNTGRNLERGDRCEFC